jgi:hypothetical protein
MQARQQFFECKWFDQVVVCTVVECGDSVRYLVACRKHQHAWSFLAVSHVTKHSHTILSWQAEIKYYQLIGVAVQMEARSDTIASHIHSEPGTC